MQPSRRRLSEGERGELFEPGPAIRDTDVAFVFMSEHDRIRVPDSQRANRLWQRRGWSLRRSEKESGRSRPPGSPSPTCFSRSPTAPEDFPAPCTVSAPPNPDRPAALHHPAQPRPPARPAPPDPDHPHRPAPLTSRAGGKASRVPAGPPGQVRVISRGYREAASSTSPGASKTYEASGAGTCGGSDVDQTDSASLRVVHLLPPPLTALPLLAAVHR